MLPPSKIVLRKFPLRSGIAEKQGTLAKVGDAAFLGGVESFSDFRVSNVKSMANVESI